MLLLTVLDTPACWCDAGSHMLWKVTVAILHDTSTLSYLSTLLQ